MTPDQYQNTVVTLSKYPRKKLEKWFSVLNGILKIEYEQYGKFPTKENEKRLFSSIVLEEIYTDALCRKLWKDMRKTFFGERINELRERYNIR